jgi:hypothetical protein
MGVTMTTYPNADEMISRTGANAAVRGLFYLDPVLHGQVTRRAKKFAEEVSGDPDSYFYRAAVELLLYGEVFIYKPTRDFFNPDYVEVVVHLDDRRTAFFNLVLPCDIAVIARAFGFDTAETVRLTDEDVAHLLIRRHPYDVRGHTAILRATPTTYCIPDGLNEDAYLEQLRRIKLEVL